MMDEVRGLPVSTVSAYGSTLQQLKLGASSLALEGVLWLLLLRWECGAEPEPSPACLGGVTAGREL